MQAAKMNIILIFGLTVFCTIQGFSCDDGDIVVEVQQGWLRGERLDSNIDNSPYYSFKGVPYAKPPVGELRFKAPEDPEPWEGTRNATAYGELCPQYNPLTKVYTAGSEDCLTLNVFSPDLKGDLPVMVYFKGAAFKFDAESMDIYGPDYFVAKDTVVVTSNSRFGELGFLNLGIKEVPGNAGLKDQVKILKWVQNNIQNFGGNPNKVTIFGQSSGSASAVYHMTSPMAKGLFQRAIAISGTPSCDAIYPNNVEERSYLLGKWLGCNTKNVTELLACLQSVPYEELVDRSVTIFAAEEKVNVLFKKMTSFVPVVEKDLGQERFIVEDYLTAVDAGRINTKDVMIGYSDQETLLVVDEYAEYLIERYARYIEMFVPSKILYNVSPNTALKLAYKIIKYYFGNKYISVENIKEFVNYANFANMVHDVQRFAKKCSRVANTYLFKFSSYSSRNYYGLHGAKYSINGSASSDATFYMFDPKPLGMDLKTNSTEYTMVEQFVDALKNFAKYGNPTPNAKSTKRWQLFTSMRTNYVEFTDKVEVKKNPDSKDIKFWDEIYESVDFQF